MIWWQKMTNIRFECHTLTSLLNLHFLDFKNAWNQWSQGTVKQTKHYQASTGRRSQASNILIEGESYYWSAFYVQKNVVNCNLKFVLKLHMNNTISYCSKGCSPTVKVTICLGNFWSTRFSRFKLSHRFSCWEHALYALPQGQEELVIIELSIHYAAINPVREWKIVKVNGWIESLFENWWHGLNSSYDGRPS